MASIKKLSLKDAFASFDDCWNPRIAGEVNGMHVKVVRAKGEFIWHQHETEDELFWVVSGSLKMRFRDGDVVVNPGEFIIVPHGVEHCPVSEEGCEIVLFEPKSTLNTGDVSNERTRRELEHVAVSES